MEITLVELGLEITCTAAMKKLLKDCHGSTKGGTFEARPLRHKNCKTTNGLQKSRIMSSDH